MVVFVQNAAGIFIDAGVVDLLWRVARGLWTAPVTANAVAAPGDMRWQYLCGRGWQNPHRARDCTLPGRAGRHARV